MPVGGKGTPVEGHIVHPHVEVGPIQHDKRDGRRDTGESASFWNNKPYTHQDFCRTTGVHPKPRVAQNGWYDGLKPSRIGKVRNAHVEKEESEPRRRCVLGEGVLAHQNQPAQYRTFCRVSVRQIRCKGS